MDDLKYISDEELAKEVERRKLEKVASARARRVAVWEHVIANKEALLKFVEHTRTSCSDTKLVNAGLNSHGYPSCARCYLLDELAYDPAPSFFEDISLELEIRIHDVRNQ